MKTIPGYRPHRYPVALFVFTFMSICCILYAVTPGNTWAADKVCSIFSLSNCSDQSSCDSSGGHWCSNTCQADTCGGASCSISHHEFCLTQDDCKNAAGYWYEGVCNDSPDRGCLEISPPAAHRVALCDAECQEAGHLMIEGGYAKVCLNYSADLDAVAGFMSADFSRIAWIDASCNLDDSFSMIMMMSQGTKIDCTVPVPDFATNEKGGWVFWMVSPTPIASLDWEKGVYELFFENTPESCAHFSGNTCVSCSSACNVMFVDDLVNMIDCATWQADNCK